MSLGNGWGAGVEGGIANGKKKKRELEGMRKERTKKKKKKEWNE